jgi:heme-degrading monooxygenase HmoA
MKRRPEMHARMTRSRVQPAKLDEALRIVQSSTVPTAKEQPGYRGYLHLVDRATGDVVSITLWASEDEMRAGETGPYYRDQISKVRSLLVGEPDVHGYEVDVQDVRAG